MGFFDFIGDTVGGLVGQIPVVGPILEKGTKSLFNSGGDVATSIGTDYLQNKLFNVPNANSAYANSERAATTAYNREKRMYQNRYQWTMKDMKAAGLNPILAASSGFNVGSAPNVASAQAFMAPPPMGSGSQSLKNVAESDVAKKQEKKIKVETLEGFKRIEKMRQDIRESIARTAETDQKTKKLVWDVLKTEQELYLAARQNIKMIYETRDLQVGIKKQQADIENINKRTKEIDQNIQFIQKKKKQLEYQLRELGKRSNLYKGKIGVVFGIIKELMSMINMNFGLIGGLPLKNSKK